MSLNTCAFQGRFTKDPELRYTQNNKAVASFTLAVDRDYDRQQADFIKCIAWSGTAEFVSKYFHKGDMATVSGRLQIREYTANDGSKRTATEIVCDSVYFCGGKRNTEQAPTVTVEPEFEEYNDGDLPF
jgi:single-strand DNA-binding protein